jgi:ABC-type bacteriocin/lantibiotic exporter with double-glycine peptidase domain
MSFYTLLAYVTGPAGRMLGINQTIQDALIAADRLYEIMAIETKEKARQGKVRLAEIVHEVIHFENVSFRYGTRALVLDDVSVAIPLARMTAIVGDIKFGEISIRDIPLKDLRIFRCGADKCRCTRKSHRRHSA